MQLQRHITFLSLLGLPSLLAAADANADTTKDTTAAQAPDFLEHMVDLLLERFGVSSAGNTMTHWGIFVGLLLAAWLLRKFVATGIFSVLKHFASKTETTLDDKLFPALEGPVKGLVFVAGSFAAFKVLKLSATLDSTFGYVFKAAFPIVIFWGIIKAISAIVDHLGEIAHEKGMGIVTFMPLIKKTIIIVFVVLAGLTIIKSFGYDVGAFIQALGIGGLAFALAAQDTIANLFASLVIAIDQPFKVGETVQIGAHTGTVEDIGMRSTRLRTAARTAIAIPNRAVANDAIINLTRMPQRRVEQTLGLTYDTTPEQLEAFVVEVRGILKNDPEVHQQGVVVNFINYGNSSLDVLCVYFTSNPDWAKHLETRERINMKIMRALAARKLSFAYPTQTIQLDGPVAKTLAGAKA